MGYGVPRYGGGVHGAHPMGLLHVKRFLGYTLGLYERGIDCHRGIELVTCKPHTNSGLLLIGLKRKIV